jgi:Spy/CpxP family protein refolding chaperone
MAAAQRATWQNWRILAMLSSVFLFGALAGALTMRAGLHAALHRLAAPASNDKQLSYERLQRDLNLTAQQSEQLRMILDDMLKYNEELQGQIESVRAQIDDVRATGKNRIVQILDPAQREKFEKICNELQFGSAARTR